MTEDSGKAYSDITTACRKKDPGKRAALHFFFFFFKNKGQTGALEHNDQKRKATSKYGQEGYQSKIMWKGKDHRTELRSNFKREGTLRTSEHQSEEKLSSRKGTSYREGSN